MKSITILLVSLLTGCSMMADSTQRLKVLGNSEHDRVTVNHQTIRVPSMIEVAKDKSVTVNAYDAGRLTFTKTIVPLPSIQGKLDTMGVYFLFPGIGLFYPGAMELESDVVFVE